MHVIRTSTIYMVPPSQSSSLPNYQKFALYLMPMRLDFFCQIKVSIKHYIILTVRDLLFDVTNYVPPTTYESHGK